MKSLSEIETTAKRASRAAGYSWGIAEEVGKSIRLSELFGFPGIKHLNQYYQNKKKENFEEIKLINKINKSDGSSFCPIIFGVNFIDQVKNIEILKKCAVFATKGVRSRAYRCLSGCNLEGGRLLSSCVRSL